MAEVRFAKVNTVALDALRDGRIVAADLAVLAFIATRVDYKSGEGKATNNEIAAGLAKGRATVIRSQARLAEAGLMEVEQTRGKAAIVKLMWEAPTSSTGDTRVTDDTRVMGASSTGDTRSTGDTPLVAPVTPPPCHPRHPLSTIDQRSTREGAEGNAGARASDPISKVERKQDATEPAMADSRTLETFADDTPQRLTVEMWRHGWVRDRHKPEVQGWLSSLAAMVETNPDALREALARVETKSKEPRRNGGRYLAGYALQDWAELAAEESSTETAEPSWMDNIPVVPWGGEE